MCNEVASQKLFYSKALPGVLLLKSGNQGGQVSWRHLYMRARGLGYACIARLCMCGIVHVWYMALFKVYTMSFMCSLGHQQHWDKMVPQEYYMNTAPRHISTKFNSCFHHIKIHNMECPYHPLLYLIQLCTVARKGHVNYQFQVFLLPIWKFLITYFQFGIFSLTI